jgi:PadR family transcriptional regulator, regulatory protein PadR
MNASKRALLEVLRVGPGYGIELIERVKVHTKGELVLDQGNAYPLLRGLEADGFLDSYEGEPLPERGGRARRYYRLTDAGHRELAKRPELDGGELLDGDPVLGRA